MGKISLLTNFSCLQRSWKCATYSRNSLCSFVSFPCLISIKSPLRFQIHLYKKTKVKGSSTEFSHRRVYLLLLLVFFLTFWLWSLFVPPPPAPKVLMQFTLCLTEAPRDRIQSCHVAALLCMEGVFSVSCAVPLLCDSIQMPLGIRVVFTLQAVMG